MGAQNRAMQGGRERGLIDVTGAAELGGELSESMGSICADSASGKWLGRWDGRSASEVAQLTQLDPLADALSKITNASTMGKGETVISVVSKLIGKVLSVLQTEGYIGGFERIHDGKLPRYRVELLGRINRARAIKPRFSAKKEEYEKWEELFLPARNVGVIVVSTPKGVMSHREAGEAGIGGVLLAYCY